MVDPFAHWSRIASATFEMGRTAARASESVIAAGTVIGARTGIARDAIRSPLTGDYVELGRMVPEKVEALTRASAAVAGACGSMQTAFLTEAQYMAALFLQGRPPTMNDLATLSARNTAYALTTLDHLVGLGSGAIAPVHARVTDNARRLGRRRQRR